MQSSLSPLQNSIAPDFLAIAPISLHVSRQFGGNFFLTRATETRCCRNGRRGNKVVFGCVLGPVEKLGCHLLHDLSPYPPKGHLFRVTGRTSVLAVRLAKGPDRSIRTEQPPARHDGRGCE